MHANQPGQAAEVASRATLEALDLPALLELFAVLAATDLGRHRLRSLRPSADAERLAGHRLRYREAAALVADGGLVPSFEEPLGELLERLAAEHGELGGPELLVLARAVGCAAAAAERLLAAAEPGPLAAAAAELPDLAAWRREVERALDSRGEVRDDASPELARLRRRIHRAREQLYGELRQVAAEHGELLSEDTVPLHEGRLVLLVTAGARGRLPGLVHGRSATGRSLYFEPLVAVEGNNRLQEAVAEEQAERQRILNRLIDGARGQAGELAELLGFLAELDALQAAARFASKVDGRLAEPADRGRLRLAAVHHPLLDPRLAAVRREALGEAGHTGTSVPIDLELDSDRRLVVVTGPNAGGKTVTLKTAGLAVLASQCGLPLAAAAGTALPVLTRVMAAVGDEQDLLHDRSTFSGRLLRLREAWEAAGPDSLVLVDELGSGTDPEEGAALAVALLEALVERGGLGLLTTHLARLAAAALEQPGAWCAAMEFDRASGQPTFRLRAGAPGGSEALALARRLALPEEWLARAEELLGSEHRDLRRLLAEVEAQRVELAARLAEAERSAERAAAAERAVEAERQALADERAKLARRLRAELDEFRRKVRRELAGEIEAAREQLATGRRKGLETRAVARLFEDAPLAEEPPPPPSRPLAVGDRVRHAGLGWQGELSKLSAAAAEVTVGGKRLRCAVGDLVLAGDQEPAAAAAHEPRSAAARRAVVVEASAEPVAELELIGRRVEPALAELDRFLDRALLASLEQVRVVHGHGSGRLRRAVREHLAGHPATASCRPGRAEEGGDGATVVTLAG